MGTALRGHIRDSGIGERALRAAVRRLHPDALSGRLECDELRAVLREQRTVTIEKHKRHAEAVGIFQELRQRMALDAGGVKGEDHKLRLNILLAGAGGEHTIEVLKQNGTAVGIVGDVADVQLIVDYMWQEAQPPEALLTLV